MVRIESKRHHSAIAIVKDTACASSANASSNLSYGKGIFNGVSNAIVIIVEINVVANAITISVWGFAIGYFAGIAYLIWQIN